VEPVGRLQDIPGFGIDRVAAAAGDDPEVLRLENLDTDVPPPVAAIEATRRAVGDAGANSWLPFNGREDLKAEVVEYVLRRGGPRYDARREVVITCGEGEAMLDALLCITDVGDEVILTDPTYAGMLNRVRLVGAVPRLVPLHAGREGWRLDLDALKAATSERTRVVFLNNASFPTGWVASLAEWEAVAELCADADLWLLYWGGFEGVLYDGRGVIHPAAISGMRERTVIVGAPSFEQRMIAWRVGWIVLPSRLLDLASRAQIYNGLVASGFAQIGARVALSLGDQDVAAATEQWQLRRDETLRQLDACRSSRRTARGRRCSTPRRLASRPPSFPPGCSSTRSQRPRWPGGAARSRPGTCASFSATSQWNVSLRSVIACVRRSHDRLDGPRVRGRSCGAPAHRSIPACDAAVLLPGT
jgi:aspartate/methionine/tyrosine aminotransferase